MDTCIPFLRFVTICNNSSKKITSFAIQAFLLFRVLKNGIDLTEGVTCAALNDTGTLKRLVQICQLIHMKGAQTTPPCISFKINPFNHKSLKGWLSQPGATQNYNNNKNTNHLPQEVSYDISPNIVQCFCQIFMFSEYFEF